MKTGTYKTKTGQNVQVQRTETGYLIRYADGKTIVLGAVA